MDALDGLVRYHGGLTLVISPEPPDYGSDKFLAVAVGTGRKGIGNTPSAALTDLLEVLEDDEVLA